MCYIVFSKKKYQMKFLKLKKIGYKKKENKSVKFWIVGTIADDNMWSILFCGFRGLKPQYISDKSFQSIVNHLKSSDINCASWACSLLCKFIGTHVTGVIHTHLNNFMKYNVLKKISNTSLLIYQKHLQLDTEKPIVFNAFEVAHFIALLAKYTKSEYTVHSIIKYNLMQRFIDLCDHSDHTSVGVQNVFFEMLKYGNEQHVQFMIHQNIIKYLCDMKWSDIVSQERFYKQNNAQTSVKILNSFLRILKCGEKNKQLNGGKNIVALLIRKYGKFKFLQKILSHVRTKQTLFSAWGNTSLISKYARVSSKDEDTQYVCLNAHAFELIVLYFIRQYTDNAKIFPQVIETIMIKFCFAACKFVVPYIHIQLDINGLVLMNVQKQCSACKTVGVNMKRCSGCKYIFYCKFECQKADWKYHKSICRKIAKYCQ
eukprot:497499_1